MTFSAILTIILQCDITVRCGMGQMLGEFEQLILMALVRLGENAYGVRMRKEIEERTGRSISAGAIYYALDRLESRGLVS